jgi:DNA polymerase-3 subunit alpha
LQPPDINESELAFAVTPNGVRFGLTAIKNVGEGAIQSLLDVRGKQGRIRSLHALCEDLDLRLVNKRVLESLVKAGAFDSLAAGDSALAGLPSTALRPRLLAAIDAACDHGTRHQRDKNEGQAQLFGAFGHPAHEDPGGPTLPLPDAAPWTETEQLAFEKETLGLYWSGHPIDRYAAALKSLGARATHELADAPVNAPRAEAWRPGGPKPIEADTSVGGIVAACRQLKTRKGDRMAVFTLEDAQGGVEVIAFPDTYQRSATLIETGTMVLVSGRLERDDESIRILAADIVAIDSVHERLAREVAIRVRTPAERGLFEALGEVFSRHRGDRRVTFEIEVASNPKPLRVRADVSAQVRVRPSPTLIAEVEQIVGQGSVSLR